MLKAAAMTALLLQEFPPAPVPLTMTSFEKVEGTQSLLVNFGRNQPGTAENNNKWLNSDEPAFYKAIYYDNNKNVQQLFGGKF